MFSFTIFRIILKINRPIRRANQRRLIHPQISRNIQSQPIGGKDVTDTLYKYAYKVELLLKRFISVLLRLVNELPFKNSFSRWLKYIA